MTEEKLKSAKTLYDDIGSLRRIINNREKQKSWIVLKTEYNEEFLSERFIEELLVFLKSKQLQYEREFGEL